MWLLLLAGNYAGPLVGSLAAYHDCRCDEHLCRCPEHHKPTLPCHYPGGSPLPRLERCDSPGQETLVSHFFVLPPQPPPLAQPGRSGRQVPPALAELPRTFRDISPPPPRTPLS